MASKKKATRVRAENFAQKKRRPAFASRRLPKRER
jgi:hypothetical protein